MSVQLRCFSLLSCHQTSFLLCPFSVAFSGRGPLLTVASCWLFLYVSASVDTPPIHDTARHSGPCSIGGPAKLLRMRCGALMSALSQWCQTPTRWRSHLSQRLRPYQCQRRRATFWLPCCAEVKNISVFPMLFVTCLFTLFSFSLLLFIQYSLLFITLVFSLHYCSLFYKIHVIPFHLSIPFFPILFDPLTHLLSTWLYYNDFKSYRHYWDISPSHPITLLLGCLSELIWFSYSFVFPF